MISRALLFAAILPFSALAQLQVYQFDGTNDTAIGPLVNVGTASPGDTVKTRFHIRNTGAGPVVLQTLSLSGQGFSIASAPSLPYTLAPYVNIATEAEVDVNFTPTTTGSFSAFMLVNTTNVSLQGAGAAAATLSVTGNQAPLVAGAPINFGSVAVGTSATENLVLSNSNSTSITVNTVTVSGTGFTGPIGLTTPVQIAPGQSVPFQIKFTPQTGTLAQGTLAVDSRTFALTAQGMVAPLPAASIALASTVGASAQQNSLTISLASAAQAPATGTLTLAFQSAVSGVTDDPAIQFLSGPARKASVSVAAGATSVLIGGQSSIAFQTGTTAGTITFTLTLPNGTEESSLTIPPSPVILDTATAVREMGSLNVAFAGFDNTYSASQLAFTFYDLSGKELPQGVINVSASSQFQQYFSTTQAGGAFQLLATFPVTGDTTQIGYVTATITNSSGTTTAQQITIQN